MTGARERMDILAELVSTANDVLRAGWMDRITVEREGSPLEGQELKLSWREDGTVAVFTYRYGEPLLVARVSIRADLATPGRDFWAGEENLFDEAISRGATPEAILEAGGPLHWLATDDAAQPNKPTGFILRRTWATVPSQWFVQTPKGDWLEVGNTHLNTHTGKQMVSIRVGEDFHVFPRDPDDEVKARRGTQAPRGRDDALDALENAFTTAILHDEPPGQS